MFKTIITLIRSVITKFSWGKIIPFLLSNLKEILIGIVILWIAYTVFGPSDRNKVSDTIIHKVDSVIQQIDETNQKMEGIIQNQIELKKTVDELLKTRGAVRDARYNKMLDTYGVTDSAIWVCPKDDSDGSRHLYPCEATASTVGAVKISIKELSKSAT